MSTSPHALLLDDGELDDVERVLRDLGIEVERRRGAAADAPAQRLPDLLVATARRALLGAGAPPGGGDPLPARVAIADGDSATVRGRLRTLGFDFLVRRPVHPTALRLLLLRALYRGPERRRDERLPIGLSVEYQAGPRRRSAVLADISPGGCRLLSRYGVRPDLAILVEIPGEGSEGPLSLRGRTRRAESEREGAGTGEISIAVEWEGLAAKESKRLRALLQRSALALRERAPAGDAPDNRRRHARRAYPRKVIALRDEASGVLMGRDLSVGGIRVEPHEGLAAGDRLELAIYAASREEPFFVKATVVRDDGALGLALAFEDLPRDTARRLEALVAALPEIERLGGGETEGLGAVIAKIVPPERSSD